MIVASDDDAIVGFGQLDAGTGEVDAIYVHPESQGEGIGRMLLSELEAQARGLGVASLQLSATLNAVEFYERAGYSRRHDTIHRLPTGIELPCVRMSKPMRE